MLQNTSPKAVAGLPFVMLALVAKLKRRCSERAFDAAVFPCAQMHASVSKLVNGLAGFFYRILGYGSVRVVSE